MRMNDLGGIIAATWCDIPSHFANVVLDAFVVMPNHLHGIVVIDGAKGAKHFSEERKMLRPYFDSFARVPV
jgi:putative transposase